jgi:hypothetical protein
MATKAVKGEVAPREEVQTRTLQIKAPNFTIAKFKIVGDEGVPLVIHRFSAKLKEQMRLKAETGKASSSKKDRAPKDSDQTFEEGRYRSKEGWDGFHAASVRNAMISACRLVDYKMTLAKMSIFVLADGNDAQEPQIPLIRIYGKPVRQDDMARVETGQPYVTVRPAYHNWYALVHIRYDADQFKEADVANLLSRVGMQVGLGEGRPDSKKSNGQGWGTFTIEGKPEEKAA